MFATQSESERKASDPQTENRVEEKTMTAQTGMEEQGCVCCVCVEMSALERKGVVCAAADRKDNVSSQSVHADSQEYVLVSVSVIALQVRAQATGEQDEGVK